MHAFFPLIFDKYPVWSWNDLSRLYTESSFLNLDLEVIPTANFDIDDKDERKKKKEKMKKNPKKMKHMSIRIPAKKK